MGDRGRGFIGAAERAGRTMRIGKRLFWIVSLGMLALALVLARVAPVASVALVVTFTLAFAARWFVQRGDERLLAAADRGDLVALAAEAKRIAAPYPALVALAVFDGPGAAERVDHALCKCGRPECPVHGLESDFAAILDCLRKVDGGGSWSDAAKSIVEGPMAPQTTLAAGVDAARVQVRMAVLQYAVFRSGRIRVPPKTLANPLRGIVGFGRALRGPIRLAAALNAKARGDLAEARAQLAQLPAWEPGSRLAAEREELERALAAEKS